MKSCSEHGLIHYINAWMLPNPKVDTDMWILGGYLPRFRGFPGRQTSSTTPSDPKKVRFVESGLGLMMDASALAPLQG